MKTKEKLINEIKDWLDTAKYHVEIAEILVPRVIYQVGAGETELWTDNTIRLIRTLEAAFEAIEEARVKLYDLQEEHKEHSLSQTEEEAGS